MKPKNGFTILHNGIGINPDKKIAQTNMRFQIPTQTTNAETKKVLNEASLWYFDCQPKPPNSVQDNVSVPQTKPVLTEDRYVNATFRGLSQIFLPNRGLDFSKPGVLEASVNLLNGKTVYPNHNFSDIYNWLGVVSNAYWDAKGEKSNGVPGVNCEIKIDAFLNYRIACGVMMNPPAINSMSLTVLFEFEYSHPQLVEERRFWNLLGEEVDGEIVRLIVVKIVDYLEASLVFAGEDRLAKNHGAKPDNEEEDFDDESLSAAKLSLPTNSNEVKTMKLTNEKKAELGIQFVGEDVPETELLKAAESLAAKVKPFQNVNIAELQAKAKVADGYVDEKRTEVTRLAKIAELGAEEGDLDEVIQAQISEASFERLQSLGKYFEKKAADRLPGARSSLESNEEIETAGGVNKTPKATVPVGGMF